MPYWPQTKIACVIRQRDSLRTPRGIGFYLTALILVAVVPMVIITGVLVWRQSELQREGFERGLEQTALALSVAVDRQLFSYRVMLETLALSELLQRGEIDQFYQQAKQVSDGSGAIFISLFSSDGRQLFNTLQPAGRTLPTPFKDPRVQLDDPDRPPVGDPTFLKRTFETKAATYSDLTYGLVAGRLIFLVNVPVMRDAKVAYVLNAAFGPEAMTRLLQENPIFRGVPAVIYDRKGFIVGRWQAADEYLGKRVRSYNQMKGKAVGSGSGTTLEGVKVYYAHATSSTTGWGVDVGSDRGAIEAQLKAIWGVGVALAALGLATGVLLALMLAGRLRKSITVLAESARTNAPPKLAGLETREVTDLKQALDSAAHVRETQAEERERRLVAEAREAEAKQASVMKDRFIAVLSHELRNPLASIRNCVALFRIAVERPGTPIKDMIEVLDRQSAHLTRLVNDLLDVSRISLQRLSLHKEHIDLRDAVQQAIETATPGLQARRHHLARNTPDHEVPVTGDLQRLSQVIANLLDNAAKFTPEGGNIEVALTKENGNALVAVKDSGRGIERSALNEIFLPFGQSERPATEYAASGLGLGLAVSRSLAELHGGSLRVHSEGPGKGSEFVLALPLAEDGRATVPARAEPDLRPIGKKVLVVDDNADAANGTAMLLKQFGCETRVAYDGETGLRLVAEWQPDVLLLDIGMPHIDGYEVARRVRNTDLAKPPLVVALSGWGQDVDKERSMAAGFDSHLVKPVGAHELRSALSGDATNVRRAAIG